MHSAMRTFVTPLFFALSSLIPLKMKTKILILTSEFPPGPGGIGNHAFNLAEQFLKTILM